VTIARLLRLFRPAGRGSRATQRPPRIEDNSSVVAAGDFNPRTSAESQSLVLLHPMGTFGVQRPERYFLGRWEDRHLLNVPGPFYGASTDTCCDGPPLALYSLMTDAEGFGFVWRQPRSDAETLSLMTGCSSDPLSGFGWDGDQRWTPALVRQWWSERENRSQTVAAAVHEVTSYNYYPENIGTAYLTYLHGDDIVRDLRRYLFFLIEGRYPDEENLPHL
jgi:hypothetical protein